MSGRKRTNHTIIAKNVKWYENIRRSSVVSAAVSGKLNILPSWFKNDASNSEFVFKVEEEGYNEEVHPGRYVPVQDEAGKKYYIKWNYTYSLVGNQIHIAMENEELICEIRSTMKLDDDVTTIIQGKLNWKGNVYQLVGTCRRNDCVVKFYSVH